MTNVPYFCVEEQADHTLALLLSLARQIPAMSKAMAAGEFAEAARCFAELGVATFEAQARLRAAADLVAAGRRREADEQLARALAFYRSVGATRYIREAEALMAASA